MNEQKILEQCKETYKLLRTTLQQFDEKLDIQAKIKQLFQKVNSQVYIKQSSPNYATYDGKVDDYTIAGSISENYLNADFNRLIEDLTMAIYRNNGGNTITYTPDLIKQIK